MERKRAWKMLVTGVLFSTLSAFSAGPTKHPAYPGRSTNRPLQDTDRNPAVRALAEGPTDSTTFSLQARDELKLYARKEGEESARGTLRAVSDETAGQNEIPNKRLLGSQNHFDRMSPMGRLAYLVANARVRLRTNGNGLTFLAKSGDTCLLGDDDCGATGFQEGPSGTQSEMTIAVDVTGQHIVVGYNDFRGFSSNPISVSGFAYSDDGGATFTDGGQLPSAGTSQLADGTKLPQIFGDPDVKYVPGGAGCQFVYSSIMVEGFGTPSGNTFPGTAETMSIHRSTDCGHTWTGPFEVTAATNPTGVSVGSNARDAADKEFIDVDPDTGRVIMSWSNFTATSVIPGGVQISTAFSDNIMSVTQPTWSARSVLNPGSTTFDTGSMPRFSGNGSSSVYVAWARESTTILASNTAVAVSANNGASWGVPVNLNVSSFFPIDFILGNDRVHSFPSVAVDNSPGPNHGNVYVVYANNNNHDGADVSFHRSTNGGTSFSAAVSLNSRPGADRPQWFPYVTVDSTTGRVSVIYYDQGIASSGDLTETTWIYSDDGGVTWSKPSPLTSTGCLGMGASPLDCRPFHAGYGNDTGQPNLGDYIGATAQGGTLYATWAGNPRSLSFADGQPTSSFTAPDFFFKTALTAQAALSLGQVSFTDSGGNGFLDPGEIGNLTIPLKNYVTNASTGTITYTGVSATLTTATAGVTVIRATSAYSDIAPGLSQSNTLPFMVQLAPTFVPGTKIEFSLSVTTAQGSTTLLLTQNTGTPSATTIFSENFNVVAPGSLPAGWTTIHAGGNNTVPWTTSNTFCGSASNALFHVNANDGLSGDNTRFERVATPNIVIPAGAEYVTLDFDICYDTEDDPNFNVLAYDGATLRITDFTAGRFARANLVEAFAESIVTGSFVHFPKHTPRSSNPNYFEDMSVWAGDSGGLKHVSMRLPGMAGSTVQLRPDYTQDSMGTCADVRPGHTCGVMIDNIVMKSVVSSAGTCPVFTINPGTVPSGAPGVAYTPTTFTTTGGTAPFTFSEIGTLSNGLTFTGGVLSGTPTQAGIFPITAVVTDAHGCAASAPYTVSITFNDVPSTHPFFTFVNTISQQGITGGCGGGNYCPDASVTREQMAIFIERGLGVFTPPTPTQQTFQDVPTTSFSYPFIEDFAARGITAGCSVTPSLYCPGSSVTREQMAIFIERALGVFSPPTPAQQTFVDVAPTLFSYPFIEDFATRGITAGCSVTPSLYCPSSPVTRGQMAVFLVRAFGL